MVSSRRAAFLFALLALAASTGVFASIPKSTILAASTLARCCEPWSADDRGRLTGSVFGTTNPTPNPAGVQPGATAVALTPADFLSAQLRTPLLDDTTRALAAAHGVNTATIDPPSSSVVELPLAAHKTSTVTENGVTRSILYDNNGGQISDDGRFVYGWDAKGLLESVTEKPVSSQVPIRRVLYYYDGNHRMVGRRAETATPVTLSAPLSTLDWQLETRSNILAADGLPSEVTFVWDPVSDSLVTVVQAGGAPNDPNAGVLKQILHGGLGYDDPIEVTSATSGNTPRRLYPTYDEAGAGTLQTVVSASGQLVARNVPTDGYGAHHLELTGAAVDAVFLEAGRDSQGVLTVDVTLRSTEQIAASSVATGIRLSTVDSKGAVVRTSTTVPRLDPLDPFAARITLTADDWTTLTDPAATSAGGLTAQALSIAVTSTLRAAGWPNDLQYLPPPDWALATAPVYGTDSLRVEVRESLPSLADWIAAIAPSGTNRRSLYQVDLLALLAKPSAGGDTPITTLLTARFQAQPFADPFTGKNYVRERWYDPERGSWLSPDPMGNRDSANLYAFAGGDPVNGRDSTGLQSRPDFTPDERRQMQQQYAGEIARLRKACERDELSDSCIGMLGTILGDVGPSKFRVGQTYSGEAALFMNGVLNDADEAGEGGKSAAAILQSPIDVLWNPSMESIPGDNLAAKILRLAFDGAQLFAVNDLHVKDRTSLFAARELRQRIRALRPGRTLRVAAHSQGLGVFGAASSLLTPAEVSRIDLVAIGGAIPPSLLPPGLHSVDSYINVFDPVAMVLGGGAVESGLDALLHEGHNVHYRAFVYTEGGWIHAIGAYAAEEDAIRRARPTEKPIDWITLYNQTMAKTYGH